MLITPDMDLDELILLMQKRQRARIAPVPSIQDAYVFRGILLRHHPNWNTDEIHSEQWDSYMMSVRKQRA